MLVQKILSVLVILVLFCQFTQGSIHEESRAPSVVDENIRLDISVFYRFSNIPNAKLQINVYEDFLHKVKLNSYLTYTDSSGLATIYVHGEEGQWIEVVVSANWEGEDKEGAEQHQVGTRDTIIKFTINLYTGFFGIDNAIAKSFIQGLVMFVFVSIVVLLGYVQWRKKFRNDRLIKKIRLSGRKAERELFVTSKKRSKKDIIFKM